MKRIKKIEGKTIVKAERGGGDFAGKENATLQLEFSDGSTFCINVETDLRYSGVFYEGTDDSGKERKLWDDRGE